MVEKWSKDAEEEKQRRREGADQFDGEESDADEAGREATAVAQ